MEVFTLNSTAKAVSSDSAFMQANTETTTLDELHSSCIIPAFAKDNESTISHQSFIEALLSVAFSVYGGEEVLAPAVRVSHPIKGRIPEAMGKPAKELMPYEETLYYERMAFAIEIPSIYQEVKGQTLSLTLGGVRAYNHENLYGRKSEERFKVFIGFKNSVCCNLCVSSDGYVGALKARTVSELIERFRMMVEGFNPIMAARQLESLHQYELQERQFAQLIGRSRMFHNNPDKKQLPSFPLTEVQVVQVVQGYYDDPNFRASQDGTLSLWNLYNLFTGANKSSYIDTFLERNVNSLTFAKDLGFSLEKSTPNWYVDI